MSNLSLFNSKGLKSLYKNGQLDKVLDLFKEKINKKTLLATGNDASVFVYNEGKQVLKLCLKDIRYFNKYKGKSGRNSAQRFQKHINSLKPFLIPVEEILYEDENVFVYTQNMCEKLNKKIITPNTVVRVFQFVQFMLKKNFLLTDIAPHNLGLYDDHIIAFDYHGLHPLKQPNGLIKRVNWWKRIMKNLARYLCYIYSARRRKQYALLMHDFTKGILEKFRTDDALPGCFLELLEYMLEKQNKADINKVCEMLETCIKDIKTSFRFQTPDLEEIEYLQSLLNDM